MEIVEDTRGLWTWGSHVGDVEEEAEECGALGIGLASRSEDVRLLGVGGTLSDQAHRGGEKLQGWGGELLQPPCYPQGHRVLDPAPAAWSGPPRGPRCHPIQGGWTSGTD